MTSAFALGLGLGIGLGLAYALTSWWTFRRALGSRRRFLEIALGAMVARLFTALAVVVLVIALAPVRESAFIGGFFFVFTLGLVVEVRALHRHLSR